MTRRLLNLLALLSLLLCVAVGVMWVRSYARGDSFGWRRAPRQVDVMSDRGVVMVAWGSVVSEYAAPEGWRGSVWPFEREAETIRIMGRPPGGRWGFGFERERREEPGQLYESTSVVFPWWVVGLPAVVVAAALGTGVMRRRRAERRRKAGACPACGYDLRGTPGRCPECGGDERAVSR